jgi:magnesium chelatase subunit D
MTGDTADEPSRWSDAVIAAALFAVDPAGIGGISLRSYPGPVRERWLGLLRDMLPASAPLRRLPLNVADSRLLGGLDLAATVRAGRPVAERGLLIEADGGAVVAAMAERLPRATAARLAAVLDTAEVVVERDGIAARHPAQLGVIALDEGIDDERPPESLRDRLAIHIALGGFRSTDQATAAVTADEILAARMWLSSVEADDETVTALCEASVALGIESLRAPLLALRVARASAALAGRDVIGSSDVCIAARLVLAPRAMQLQEQEQSDSGDAGDDAQSESEPSPGNERPDDGEPNNEVSLGDIVLAAAQAALPAGVLAHLKLSQAPCTRPSSSGRAGAVGQSSRRGRPIGSRRGHLRAGARLNVIDTLRAAVPWQGIRRRERDGAPTDGRPARIEVRREDFHVARFKQRTETTTVFVVDASGSAALNRLAEAKGAVEYLLADCYVRRDRVALISFRGPGAELLLPPTRSLVRAKRGLAGLPGGGGTPLAAGIDAARGLADALQRRGETATVVLLTDGRANIARDGSAGRARAEDDAVAAARLMRHDAINALLIDTSPRAQPFAQRLATEMGAAYLVLPFADAAAVANVVRASAEGRRPGGARI